MIVRSDGTVTYVGKDIAYQLWKFGLLGLDFKYRRWGEAGLWETTSTDDGTQPPAFGGASKVINVIDARQSYLQRIVRAGLEALGHSREAEQSVHFAYEMVSLVACRRRATRLPDRRYATRRHRSRCRGAKASASKPTIFWTRSKPRHATRSRSAIPSSSRRLCASSDTWSATAALRFFMVKATTTRVIAFDFQEAVSFEGETGPYLQYSAVRERKIRRKLEAAGMPTEVDAGTVRGLDAELWTDDLWDLVLTAAQTPEAVEKGASTLELSLIARQALDLAGKFHGVYNRHRILDEADQDVPPGANGGVPGVPQEFAWRCLICSGFQSRRRCRSAYPTASIRVTTSWRNERGTPIWVTIGCGCGLLVMLVIGAIVAAGFFGFSAVKGYVEDMKDPSARGAKAAKILGSRAASRGLYGASFSCIYPG